MYGGAASCGGTVDLDPERRAGDLTFEGPDVTVEVVLAVTDFVGLHQVLQALLGIARVLGVDHGLAHLTPAPAVGETVGQVFFRVRRGLDPGVHVLLRHAVVDRPLAARGLHDLDLAGQRRLHRVTSRAIEHTEGPADITLDPDRVGIAVDLDVEEEVNPTHRHGLTTPTGSARHDVLHVVLTSQGALALSRERSLHVDQAPSAATVAEPEDHCGLDDFVSHRSLQMCSRLGCTYVRFLPGRLAKQERI